MSNPLDEKDFSAMTCEEYAAKCCEADKECIYDGKWWCAECIYLKFQEEIDALIMEECSCVDYDLGEFLDECTTTEFITCDDEDNFTGLIVLTPSSAVPRVVITLEMIKFKKEQMK